MTTAIQPQKPTLRRACVAALALLVTIAAAMAMVAQPAAASSSNPFEGAGPLTPQIINGKESSISEFPWQVWVLLKTTESEATCGGSILNSTTILTAAHCTDHDGTTTPYTIVDEHLPETSEEAVMFVVSGASKGLGFVSSGEYHPEPTNTAQGSFVKSVRRDPYYAVSPEIKDDVAVLTLATELKLSPEYDTQAISLVGAGDTPPPGTTLSISGYGKQNGKEGVNSNGNLYSTTLTAIGSDECREGVKLNSAVLLCAGSTTSSTCQGDSGGPLTEGSPAVEVGIVDFGAKECPVGVPDVFTNVAAPEVRDFIEGSESPPVAARLTSPAPSIKTIGSSPVALSTLTCEPGGWSGSPTFSYTFKAESSSAHQVLQSGTGNTFTPPTSLVGTPVVCVVQASNPGGVSTERSATTAAIATDTTPPTVTLGALTCAKTSPSCTLAFNASDPNGLTISEQASAAYSVVAKCPKEKKKKKKSNKKTKPKVCHATKTVPMAISGGTGGAFQASLGGLPYSEAVTFTVEASNAAGLKAAPLSTHTTLTKPKPKKKPKKKKSKKKG